MHAAMPARNGRDGAAIEALRWLARFPLVEAHHLEAFTGADRWAVTGLLRDLRERGIIVSVMIDSPEFAEARRVYYLTAAGAGALAHAVSLTAAELEQQLPVGRRELLTRIARIETALAVAGFIADLSAALRDGQEARIVDARSSHWARSPKQTSGLPAVEAHVHLCAGEASATFALAWDRAAAPAAHRKRRVAAWYRADEIDHRRVGQSLPPVLVVCPDERTLRQWEVAVERSATRRARDLLPLYLADVGDLHAQGPHGACWRRPGSRRLNLVDCLAWRTASPACGSAPPLGTAFLDSIGAEAKPHRMRALRPWELERVRSGETLSLPTRAERSAALAIGLGATEKTLLNWVGHHPLLPSSHLATHLDLPMQRIVGLLDGLLRHGLVAVDRTGAFGDTEGPRYVLLREGAAVLAARDGVPVGLYLSEGVIAADGLDSRTRSAEQSTKNASVPVRLSHLRRHPEHTAGIHRFALSLATAAKWQRMLGRDHRLLAWLNDAEGQVWFRHDGRVHHIWPDGRFRYRADGIVYDLLLEWDRGIVRRRDYTRKLRAYASYFNGSDAVRHSNQHLVMVTTTAAEQRLRSAVIDAAEHCSMLTTVVCIITANALERPQGDPLGPLASILQRRGYDGGIE